jgi:hypothetical protein
LLCLVGILLNNGRLNDLNLRLGDLRSDINQRFASVETRLELILGKVIDLDTRVAVLEDRHIQRNK